MGQFNTLKEKTQAEGRVTHMLTSKQIIPPFKKKENPGFDLLKVNWIDFFLLGVVWFGNPLSPFQPNRQIKRIDTTTKYTILIHIDEM